jgi:hypothetical protein
LLHLGQSVDFVVSIAFLRSPVLAILAIGRVFLLWKLSLHTRAGVLARLRRRGSAKDLCSECWEAAGLAALVYQERECVRCLASGLRIRSHFGWPFGTRKHGEPPQGFRCAPPGLPSTAPLRSIFCVGSKGPPTVRGTTLEP